MPSAIDLDSYFQRIGYAGERTPTLETLCALHLRHTQAIAFENLNPLMRWPVRLEPLSLQHKMVRSGRMRRAGGDFVMQARLRDDWKALYRFDTHRHLPCDYAASNYYLSTHPDSRFTNTLIAARPSTDRRYALLNNELTERRLNGGSKHRLLTSAAELREALEELFKLVLPHAPQLDAVLARVVLGSTVR
jgi:N-hydroxyarylamine O-acetyltransferase